MVRELPKLAPFPEFITVPISKARATDLKRGQSASFLAKVLSIETVHSRADIAFESTSADTAGGDKQND